MQILTVDQANNYLKRVSMRIGEWNRIENLEPIRDSDQNWINSRAPRNVNELMGFSLHVAGWLPKGQWKFFQIDDATGWLNPLNVALISGLLGGTANTSDIDLNNNRSFLFEFLGSGAINGEVEIRIALLIFVFLLFELHAYLVSSGSTMGETLAIQDGFIYFYSRSKDLSSARTIIKNFEQGIPSRWIGKLIADAQENHINSQKGGERTGV